MWGVVSLLMYRSGWSMSISARTVVTAGTAPIVGAAIWAIAAACTEVVRDDDCLARIGGDELAVIAPRAGSAGVALLDCADQRLLYRKRLNKTAF